MEGVEKEGTSSRSSAVRQSSFFHREPHPATQSSSSSSSMSAAALPFLPASASAAPNRFTCKERRHGTELRQGTRPGRTTTLDVSPEEEQGSEPESLGQFYSRRAREKESGGHMDMSI
ncbi:unnamed protein product, partial [Amoebophrya sp. A25]